MKEIDNFLEELSLKNNFSTSTVVAYEKDLNDFVNYFNEQELNFLNLSEENFINYFEHLKENYKMVTIRRKYSSIKKFYKYLWKHKLVNQIFEYNLDKNKEEINNIVVTEKNLKSNASLYENFINNLNNNDFYELRLKLISTLVAELNINLVNIFEIQIKDLLKYDFKKIVIIRNHKIFDYDLNKKIESLLREYYKKFAFEKRFLFSTYNISAFRRDLKKYGLSRNDLRLAFYEDNETIYENIKKIYFEIGIGE